MRQLIHCVLALLTLLLTLFGQTGFGQIAPKELFLGKIEIIPPASDLPEEIQAFSGRWEGVSEHGVLVAMVFKELFPDRADIVWGSEDFASLVGVSERKGIRLPLEVPAVTILRQRSGTVRVVLTASSCN